MKNSLEILKSFYMIHLYCASIWESFDFRPSRIPFSPFFDGLFATPPPPPGARSSSKRGGEVTKIGTNWRDLSHQQDRAVDFTVPRWDSNRGGYPRTSHYGVNDSIVDHKPLASVCRGWMATPRVADKRIQLVQNVSIPSSRDELGVPLSLSLSLLGRIDCMLFSRRKKFKSRATGNVYDRCSSMI